MGVREVFSGLLGNPLARMRRAIAGADRLASRGDTKKAAAMLRKEIEGAEKQSAGEAAFEGCLELAGLLRQSGDGEGMIGCLKRAGELAAVLKGDFISRFADQVEKNGLAATGEGNRPISVSLFLEAKKYAELSPLAMKSLALALVDQNRDDRTSVGLYIEYLAKYRGDQPVSGRVAESLRAACEVSGSSGEAVVRRRESFNRRVLEAGLEWDWTWRNLGKSFLLGGKWNDARRAFTRAMEINPLDASDMFHTGYAAYQEKDFTASSSLLASYAMANPRHGAGACLLGMSRAGEFYFNYAHRRPEDGISLLRDAVRHIEAGLGIAWKNDAKIVFKPVEQLGAPGVIDRRLKLNSTLFMLGRVYDMLDNPLRAVALEAISVDYGDPDSCGEYAGLLAREGHRAKALETIGKGLERSPGDPGLTLLYADLRMEERPEEAAEILDRVLEADGENLAALLAAARLALLRENLALCASLLDRCQALADRQGPNETSGARAGAVICFYRGRVSMLEGAGGDYHRPVDFLRKSLDLAEKASSWLNRHWCRGHRRQIQYWIGICHAHMGDYGAAGEYLGMLIGEDGQNAEALAQMALIRMAEGRRQEAAHLLEKGEAIDGDLPALRFARARMLAGEGRPDQARDLMAGLAGDGRDTFYQAMALLSIGAAQEARGDAEGAIVTYGRALALKPSLLKAHWRRGVLLARRMAVGEELSERIPEALGHLETAAGGGLGGLELLYLKAELLGRRGDYQSAIGICREITSKPDIEGHRAWAPKAYELWGQCLYWKGDLSGARKRWEECLSLTSGDSVRIKIAYTYFYEGLEKIDPGKGRRQTGRSGIKVGQAEAGALDLFQKALEIAPDNLEFCFYAALAKMLNHRFEEAGLHFASILPGEGLKGAALFFRGLNAVLAGIGENMPAAFDRLKEFAGTNAGSPDAATARAVYVARLLCAVYQRDFSLVADLAGDLAAAAGPKAALPFDTAPLRRLEAVSLARRGKIGEAVKLCREHVAERRDNAGLVEVLVRLLGMRAVQEIKSGKMDDALKSIDEALKLCEEPAPKG